MYFVKIQNLKPIMKNVHYYFFQMFNFFWSSFIIIMIPADLMDDDIQWGAETYHGSGYESKEKFVVLMVKMLLIFIIPGILVWFLSKRKRWWRTLVAAIPSILFIYAHFLNIWN